jgi:tRNA nucleotidyltransferase (CCA-adding enzyme)
VVRDIVCHCEPQAKQSHTSKEIASAFKEGLAMTPGGTGLPRPHTRHRNDNNDNVDIDIVVCGDWRKFTSLLAKKFGAKSIFFPQFLGGHFTIQTGKNKYEVNITHTRKESYIKSGSLPRVVPTTLEEDLGRRDFAMNAIAVSLNPENYLQIIDVYDGIEDILHKCIRVLKKNSFREDPTRIIRAIRYEVRLGFRMTQDTLVQMKNAINAGCIARIPGERLRDELILNLKERAVYEGILRLFKYGVFSSVWPELTLTITKKRYIQRIITRWESLRPLDLSVPVERRLKPAATGLFVERWLCLLIAVCWGASSNSSREKSLLLKREITGHLGLNKRQSQALINSEVQIRKAQRIICKKDTKASAITRTLDCCDEYALAMMLLIATSRRVSGRIIRYVNDWKKRKPLLNGNDLKKIGLKPGPKFQKILAELRLAQIDGKISTRQQAKQFVKRPR